MKLKTTLFLTEVDGAYYLVDSDCGKSRFNGMIKLNQTGKTIVEALQNETTADEIAEVLCEKYEVSKETAVCDIRRLIDTLRSVNLIENEA